MRNLAYFVKKLFNGKVLFAFFIAEDTSGELAMNDGESLDLQYFAINELLSQLDERAKIIIEKYFI